MDSLIAWLSQHKHEERSVRPVLSNYLSVSCYYDLNEIDASIFYNAEFLAERERLFHANFLTH